MKKNCALIGFAALFSLSLNAQVRPWHFPAKSEYAVKTPRPEVLPFKDESLPTVAEPTELANSGVYYRSPEELVGSTTWDAQSYGAMSSRIYADPQGNPVANWLFSLQNTGNTDRGTAHNVRQNGIWPDALSRVEVARTGFPAAVILGDGSEVIISHNTGSTPWKLWMAKKAAGSNTWVETGLPSPPASTKMLWPKVAVGGPDNMTIHVIGITAPTGGSTTGAIYDGLNGHILYYRSTDGGTTWDKQFVKIPGLDNSHYTGFSADSYNIDANGNTVVVGEFIGYDWNDVRIYKSSDNGENWTEEVVLDFPDVLEGYDPHPGLSYSEADVPLDTLAPNLDPLAVLTNDGFGEVLVDQNGQAHVWFGRAYVVDNDFTDSISYVYPSANGIIYWKESWGANNMQIITGAFDYNGDNAIITDNEEIAPYGNAGISSFPVAGIDNQGTIYLCYAAVNEMYRTGSGDVNDEFFRHLYIMKSTSNGDGWGEPLELTAPPYVDEVLSPIVECVYPAIPNRIGSKVWVLYQQDFLPGTNIWGNHHSAGENFINWIEVDPAEIATGVKDITNNDLSQHLILSPNPATTASSISTVFSGKNDAKIEILDVLGKNVATYTFPVNAGKQTLNFPTSALKNGVYMVRVSDGQQFATTKLFKN